MQNYVEAGEFSDPSERKISVRATAKDTPSSPDLRLEYQFTGRDQYDESPLYQVSIRK
jgi:hypothetical protein